jgi:hypothetical protein
MWQHQGNDLVDAISNLFSMSGIFRRCESVAVVFRDCKDYTAVKEHRLQEVIETHQKHRNAGHGFAWQNLQMRLKAKYALYMLNDILSGIHAYLVYNMLAPYIDWRYRARDIYMEVFNEVFHLCAQING